MTGLAAIVFDMDGVLVDSEALWDEVRRDLVAEHGLPWKPEATAAMMGMSSLEWTVYVRDELGVPMEPPEISREVVARLLARYDEAVPWLPGAQEAVRRSAAAGPLGLASSSNREVIDRVLAHDGLVDCFGATVSSEEVGIGKPAPDVYVEAARRLGVDPAQCGAVEDSANGIRAALAAGMRCVALPNPHFPPPGDVLARAHAVIASLDELPAAFDRA